MSPLGSGEEAGQSFGRAVHVGVHGRGCLVRVADAVDQLAFWDPSHFTTAGSTYFVDAVADELLRGV